jgi:hypothetical protein
MTFNLGEKEKSCVLWSRSGNQGKGVAEDEKEEPHSDEGKKI